jgi:hypothetical protein
METPRVEERGVVMLCSQVRPAESRVTRMAACAILQPATAARLQTHIAQKKRLTELMGAELAEHFVWVDCGPEEAKLPLCDVNGYWSGGSPKEEAKSLFRLMEKGDVPLNEMLDLIRASDRDRTVLAEWVAANPSMKVLVDRALRHRESVEREFLDCIRGLTRVAARHLRGKRK